MFNQLNNTFVNLFKSKKIKITLFITSIIIYLYSRIVVLNGELLTEEWLFLSPGINLFSKSVFFYDWGILVPDGNPFHKPPLTSLIYGLFSNLLNDQVYSARIFSLIVNLLGLILLYRFTNSILIALFYIFSYYFLASSIIIQTDVLVFLGFIILCFSQIYFKKKFNIFIFFLFFGFSILWMSKIESALIMLFCYSLYYIFLKEKKYFLYLYLINLTCILITFLLIFFLSNFTNDNFNTNLLSIFYPIERIVGQQSENLIFNFGNYLHSLGFIVIKFFKFGLMPEIIFITLLIFYFLRKNKYLIDNQILFFLIFFIAPISIYFFVGYAGLQYPRYFIFPYYSLLIVFGLIINKLTLAKNFQIAHLTIVFLIILNLKDFYFLLKNDGNLFPQEVGKKEVAVFLKDKNIYGNLITYEYFSGYIKNKSYLWDVIKGYKVNQKKVLNNLENIEGMVLKKGDYNNDDVNRILKIYQNTYILEKIEFKNYDLWLKKL